MRVINPESSILKFPKSDTGFKVAVVTMVYNEKLLLPLWCRHYGRQLGYENLFVLDHGSTDGAVDPTCCNQIRIPRYGLHEGPRAELVSLFQAALLTTYDVVIYTDCDEFLVARPSKHPSLLAYLQNRAEPVTRCVGMNPVPHEPDFQPLDLEKPILLQRPYGFLTHRQYKTIVTSIPLNWSYGFHNCDRPDHFDPDLWMFHIKLADLQYGDARRDPAEAVQKSAEALRFINHLQSNREDVYFTDEELFHWLQTQQSSPLRRIPEEFSSAF